MCRTPVACQTRVSLLENGTGRYHVGCVVRDDGDDSIATNAVDDALDAVGKVDGRLRRGARAHGLVQQGRRVGVRKDNDVVDQVVAGHVGPLSVTKARRAAPRTFS